MSIKRLLQEANAIQVGISATDWREVIALAAQPLVSGGYVKDSIDFNRVQKNHI